MTSFLNTPVAEHADSLLAHLRGERAGGALQRTNRIIEHKRIIGRNRGE